MKFFVVFLLQIISGVVLAKNAAWDIRLSLVASDMEKIALDWPAEVVESWDSKTKKYELSLELHLSANYQLKGAIKTAAAEQNSRVSLPLDALFATKEIFLMADLKTPLAKHFLLIGLRPLGNHYFIDSSCEKILLAKASAPLVWQGPHDRLKFFCEINEGQVEVSYAGILGEEIVSKNNKGASEIPPFFQVNSNLNGTNLSTHETHTTAALPYPVTYKAGFFFANVWAPQQRKILNNVGPALEGQIRTPQVQLSARGQLGLINVGARALRPVQNKYYLLGLTAHPSSWAYNLQYSQVTPLLQMQLESVHFEKNESVTLLYPQLGGRFFLDDTLTADVGFSFFANQKSFFQAQGAVNRIMGEYFMGTDYKWLKFVHNEESWKWHNWMVHFGMVF